MPIPKALLYVPHVIILEQMFNFICKIPEYIFIAYFTICFVLLRFILSIPLIAYTILRMILNFSLQVTSLTLSAVNLTFAKIEETLFMKATALRKDYHSLGSDPSAYGFIFITNIPYYFIKLIHITVIIFALMPINIVSKSLAFLAYRVNLPTAKTLMEYIKFQTDNLFCNIHGHRYTLDVCIGFMLFNLFAALDMMIATPLKKMQSTLESYRRHGEKHTNTYTANVNFRKTAYTLKKIINFIKVFITTLTGIINFFLCHMILVLSATLLFFIIWPAMFHDNFLKIFENLIVDFGSPFIAALCFIFGCLDFQPYNASILYMSFTAIEYMFIRTIDTVSEIISVPFRWIEQAFTSLSQLFNDQAFDYRESEDSIDKYLVDIRSHKNNCVNINDFSPDIKYNKKFKNQLFEKDIEVADELIHDNFLKIIEAKDSMSSEGFVLPFYNQLLAEVQSNTKQRMYTNTEDLFSEFFGKK